ncbi:hypothetical protein C0J52_08685 [Blattella germanica]|nr:hypothetical protein C0J52_08685 [Blattella germanica]
MCPQGSRKRGRPEITWKRTIGNYLHVMGKTWFEAKRLANESHGDTSLRLYAPTRSERKC